MKRKLYLLLLLLLLNVPTALCQTTIFGVLKDSMTTDFVEFASVKLIEYKNDNKILTGAISDSLGYFKLDKVPYGDFTIEISCLGYKPLYISISTVYPQKITDLKSLFLTRDDILLSDVIIDGDKRTISLKADRKILSIDETMSKAGESAADVMQLIPEIKVDGNNITLKNQSFTVFINNKPSSLSKSQLFQIPAATIDKIEVITNPSVKYKPDGLGGIVNIILKKNPLGINGIIQASIGSDNYYNGALTFNYKSNKFNLFTTLYPRYYNLNTTGYSITNTFQTSVLNEYSKNKQIYFNENFKIGFDFDITTNDLISAYWHHNFYKGDYSNKILSEFEEIFPTSTVKKNDIEKSTYYNRNNNLSINFIHKFNSEGMQLSIDFLENLSGNSEKNTISSENENQIPISNPYKFTPASHIKSSDADISFSTPLYEKFDANLEVGINASVNSENEENSFAAFVNDTWQTSYKNLFSYKNVIASFYSLLDFNIHNFNFILGARAENFSTNVGYDLEKKKDNKYFFYPNFAVSYKLNDINSFNFNYDKRIERPEGYQLNPIIYSGDYITERYIGNQNLEESFSNVFELGYLFYKNNFYLNTSISYTDSKNVIDKMFFQEQTIRYKTWANIANIQSCIINTALNWKMSFITSTLSGSVYKVYYTKKNDINTEKNDYWNYDIRFIPRIKLKNDYNILLQILYYSSQYYAYSKRTDAFKGSLTLSKTFKKDLTISLRVNNFINKIPHTIVWGENFNSESYMDNHSQAIYLGIFYQFGRNIKIRAKTDINTSGILLQREN